MSDTVEKIKERLSIVDVVGAYVKLTRAGKYWKGLSPFTKEKTPSFFVTPDRGLYHCFSTGKGGDMFTFIEEMEGVDFRGALKLLAEKAGVEIVQEAPGVRGEREELYAALAAADQYFRSVLATRPDAKNYLAKRGVDQSVVDHWHIGYAPKEWHALKEVLTKKGFSERILEVAGLIKKADQNDAPGKDARTYDRFRGRIMFPIFDATGRVIAYSGRIFEDDPVHPQAKYLNSPEGPLFDKSRALYGIQDAKNAVRELGFTMLVEGQVDLVMAHRAGYRSAVATSGTAFTAAHAEILKRYSPNVLIAYDGDAAGIAAAGRASQILLPRGMNVKVVRMPPGVDPADLIHENPAAFKEAVKQALPVVDFFLTELQDKIRDPRNLKLEVGRVVLPYIALIDNALDRAHFVDRVAATIGVGTDAVQTELKKLSQTPLATSTPTTQQSFLREDRGEALLFGILSTFEEAGDARATRIEKLFILAFGAERLATLRAAEPREIEEARIIASENFFVLYEDAEAQERFITTLEQEVTNRNQSAKDEYTRVKRLLHDAEQKGDSAAVQRLMQELTQLSKQLN